MDFRGLNVHLGDFCHVRRGIVMVPAHVLCASLGPGHLKLLDNLALAIVNIPVSIDLGPFL